MKKTYLIVIIVIVIIVGLYWYFANVQKTEAPATVTPAIVSTDTGTPNIPAGTSISDEVGG
ncbi:MAG: hypothetical protein NTV48_01845 [Candidatus Vogelbacteria bacterium]|nr:hypothetical protein [Candidatus Vogelbacteria bacterium]